MTSSPLPLFLLLPKITHPSPPSDIFSTRSQHHQRITSQTLPSSASGYRPCARLPASILSRGSRKIQFLENHQNSSQNPRQITLASSTNRRHEQPSWPTLTRTVLRSTRSSRSDRKALFANSLGPRTKKGTSGAPLVPSTKSDWSRPIVVHYRTAMTVPC